MIFNKKNNYTRKSAVQGTAGIGTLLRALSANLRQRENFNQKSSGIPIRIAGLIRIGMSVGSVPKCCRALSSRRQSFRQVGL